MPETTPRTPAPQGVRPGRRERHRAEVRGRLLRAALRLFAERGFTATTVADITEAADVGKGTFFNYFPSKEHVLAAFGEMQMGKVEQAWERVRAGKEPLREVLRWMVHRLAEEPGRSQTFVRSVMAAHLMNESVREHLLRNLERGRRNLAKIFALGQERGDIRRDLRPAELARIFQQFFFGTVFFWSLQPASKLMVWLDPGFDLLWAAVAAGKKK